MSYLYLLPSCVLTKGYRRSLLHDTHSGRHRLLSPGMAAVLAGCSGRKKDVWLQRLQIAGMDHEACILFLNSLTTDGFLWESPAPVSLPPADTHADWPCLITNAIIDIAGTNLHLLPAIAAAFRTIDCPHVQIRVYRDVAVDLSLLEAIKNILTADALQTADLILPFFDDYATLPGMLQPVMITGLTLYNAAQESVQPLTAMTRVLQIREVLHFPGCCGLVQPAYFNFGLQHYTESIQHNTCLNRKLAIDQWGNIKNCPSMQEHYGNIVHTKLADVIALSAFHQYASISKKQVSVCSDCEFRHVCTDCRAYLQTPDDLYSKPLKCGYDPYNCIWQDWASGKEMQGIAAFYGIIQ